MLGIFGGLFAKIAVSLLDAFLQKKVVDDASKKDYLAFTDIMTRKGLMSVERRMAASANVEQQLKDMWAKQDVPKESK